MEYILVTIVVAISTVLFFRYLKKQHMVYKRVNLELAQITGDLVERIRGVLNFDINNDHELWSLDFKYSIGYKFKGDKVSTTLYTTIGGQEFDKIMLTEHTSKVIKMYREKDINDIETRESKIYLGVISTLKELVDGKCNLSIDLGRNHISNVLVKECMATAGVSDTRVDNLIKKAHGDSSTVYRTVLLPTPPFNEGTLIFSSIGSASKIEALTNEVEVETVKSLDPDPFVRRLEMKFID